MIEAPEETAPSPRLTASAAAPPRGSSRRSRKWVLDLCLFVLLCAAAFPNRWAAATGDLWYDEADYAQAAVRGFEANRWDTPDPGQSADQLIRLRHFHPPLIAQVLGLALELGRDERTLRLPFVLAGCVTVGVLYLCALSLFRRPRSDGGSDPLRVPAIACAVILIFTPAHVRAASHAIPWAWITLWLVALLWTYLRYARTRRPRWLAVGGALFGLLFVTSEYAFPALAIAAAALVVLCWSEGKRRRERLIPALSALAMGALLFCVVTLIFWPAGPLGGAVRMLQHYVEMADTNAFPITIEGQRYERAPRWAYLYWYWTEFRLHLLFYAVGAAATLWLLVRRGLTVEILLVGAFAAATLAVAHRAHIIGPEYLAHALPFLILLGGLPFAALVRAQPWHSLPVVAAVCWVVASSPEVQPLNGMEPRSRVPRWRAAAQFMADRWQPGDRILASQYAVTARWYLLHDRRVPATDQDVRILPAHSASEKLVNELLGGEYRWVVVGSTFTDWTDVDNRLRMIIQRWKVVYRSEEHGQGPSRILIYERPAGLTPERPQRAPWLLPPGDWLPVEES